MIEIDSSSIVILHQNIRSLRKNFDLLLADLTTNNILPDLIILTETWINSSEIDFYNIPNYYSIAKCNDELRSGGIIIYIKNSIVCNSNLDVIKMVTADILKISVRVFKLEFHILALYRLHLFTIEQFVNEMERVLYSCKAIQNLLVIGDMNINILLNISLVDNYKMVMAVNGLECLVNEPTRIAGDSATCIDHVFARVSCKNTKTVEATVIHSGLTDHAGQQVCVSWVSGSGRATVSLPPLLPLIA